MLDLKIPSSTFASIVNEFILTRVTTNLLDNEIDDAKMFTSEIHDPCARIAGA